MSLLVQISVTFDEVAKTITASDTTGFYNALTNPGGYGAPNLDRSEITSASLVIWLNKVYFFSKDVTDIIKTSADAEVDLGEITAEFSEDGAYKIFLIVNSSYSKGSLVFVTEEAKAMMSLYWCKLACIYDIYKKKELEKECIWLESNLQGVPSLERRGLESEFINLLGFIQRRFEVNQSLIA